MENLEECEKCNGTGYIQIEQSKGHQFVDRVCPVCDGVGELEKDESA